MKIMKTLKLRVKDKHRKILDRMAVEVNQVFNYANQASYDHIKKRGKWLSGFDINKLTSGATKEFKYIKSVTIQECGQEYAKKRRQSKLVKLAWRKSFGNRRSLGWVPFKIGSVRFAGGKVRFAGNGFDVWDSYGLDAYSFRSGCFSEDSRGRWYLCISIEVEKKPSLGAGSVGIDLGCKETATDSNGHVVTGREYRKLEERLKTAQRANKKRQVQTIHAKIKNRRADTLHKYSRMLVDQNAAIFVGNVSSSKLVKTKMAKSVLDAGWHSLKTMLSYKSEHAGVVYREVNEAYTTRTCSSCGVIPDSSPKGLAGLNKRNWRCDECGVHHDRDINSAINILALGHQGLEAGVAA